MVRSSKRSGHSPFKAVMLGSSPARITITMGYSQVAKAPVFDTGIVGSGPAIPAMIRYSSGSRGQSAKLLIAGWRQKLQPIKCNCPVGSCSRRLDGAKPLFSHRENANRIRPVSPAASRRRQFVTNLSGDREISAR